MKFPLSALDLSPISAGSRGAQVLRNILDLARHAGAFGLRGGHRSGDYPDPASRNLDHLHEWELLATAG